MRGRMGETLGPWQVAGSRNLTLLAPRIRCLRHAGERFQPDMQKRHAGERFRHAAPQARLLGKAERERCGHAQALTRWVATSPPASSLMPLTLASNWGRGGLPNQAAHQ
jgi:hypothetical protein